MNLTEKYRPKEWDKIIGQEHIIPQIREMCKKHVENQSKMPNLLFTGPAGTGKTTLAHLIGKTIFGDNYKKYFKEFNASNTRRINDVREIIIPLTKSVVPIIIFFDEADGIGDVAQEALRPVMEKSVNAIFILACNRENKVIEPLRSRCVPFRFRKLQINQIVEILGKIIIQEKIVLEPTPETREAILEIVKQSNGDARQSINLLERIITSNQKLNVKSVLEYKTVKTASLALNAALSGNFEKAKNLIQDAYLNSSNDVDIIIDELWNTVETLTDIDLKIRLFYELGQLESKIQFSHRPLYQLVAFISYAYISPKLSRNV